MPICGGIAVTSPALGGGGSVLVGVAVNGDCCEGGSGTAPGWGAGGP
jgi:hypothetical protein